MRRLSLLLAIIVATTFSQSVEAGRRGRRRAIRVPYAYSCQQCPTARRYFAPVYYPTPIASPTWAAPLALMQPAGIPTYTPASLAPAPTSIAPVPDVVSAPASVDSEVPASVALFNAVNMDGWEGNQDIFRIEDGAIVGGTLNAKIAHNEFLTTKKEYANFELRLKFMLKGERTNAGIQIRSRRIDNPPHEMIGYQADLGQQYWGALYDESRRRKILAGPDKEELNKVLKRNDWNEYRIRCEGKRIQLWINGLQTVDYTEEDNSIEQTGFIGLQIHGGPPGEAWYKDIQIEEL